MSDTHFVVGKPIGRVDGPEKVTGKARYTADVLLPGFVWGKALRSPLPHAKIVRVETAKAKALPGVLAVLTAKDLPNVLVGRRMFDMPILARDRVRFIGEKVAAVAAENPETAEEALQLIEVEYEDLPAVFDPVEALRESAPILHEDPAAYAFAPQETRPHRNVQSIHHTLLGDVDAGFREADRIFEHTFTTQLAHQGYLEPHAGMVAIDNAGRVQIWTSNKMPFRLKELIAHATQLPQEKILVNLTPIGGDFGGKGSLMDIPLCYFLARATGRPVKMVMSYTEELMAGNPRHPSVITLRTGVGRDGRIVARTARAIFNGGAYAAFKPVPTVNLHGADQAGGVYRIPNIAIESICVYTNSIPCGHARAPGEPQMIFAVESHTDMIAHDLGLDPVEFRRRNLLTDGDRLANGRPLSHVKAKESLDAALEAIEWSLPRPRPFVGRGVAMSHRAIGIGESNAKLRLEEDGSLTLLTAAPDTGTGAYTMLQQVVAETLRVPPDKITVKVGDTDSFENDSGAGGSRVTHVAGQAAFQAATELRKRITKVAARFLELPEEELELREARVVAKGDRSASLSLAEVSRSAREAGVALDVSARYSATSFSSVTSFCTQAAEVEVDPETGQVKILRLVNSHDVGTVINPIGHQGQIEGGLIQGMGFAVMEEMRASDGRIETLNLGDYKIPNIKDIPPLTTVILEDAAGPGPYQAKSIGEGSISPVGAAIANAVFDACGVRITDLPLTAEKVFFALKRKGTPP